MAQVRRPARFRPVSGWMRVPLLVGFGAREDECCVEPRRRSTFVVDLEVLLFFPQLAFNMKPSPKNDSQNMRYGVMMFVML